LELAEYNSDGHLQTFKFLHDDTDRHGDEFPMREFIWNWPKNLAIFIGAKPSASIDL